MRVIAISAVIALLSGCAVPTVAPIEPAAPTQFTPVRWKENTPRAQRAQDTRECELASVGLDFRASEEEVFARSQQISQAQLITFVDRCMANKGYEVTDKRVCTAADLRSGTFVSGASIDALPPLSSVRCMSPNEGGFVV